MVSAKVSNSHLASRTWWVVPSLSICLSVSDAVLAASTCSKIAHCDCECSHCCQGLEKAPFVEEGERSKVVGIGPVVPGYLASVVPVRQMR